MPNKPSKKWWDEKTKEIQKGNPDYTKEQVDKTVGDIFFHKLSPSEKEKAMRHGSHLVKAINLIADSKGVDYFDVVIVHGEGDDEGTIERYTGPPHPAFITKQLRREKSGGDRWAIAYARATDESYEKDTYVRLMNGRPDWDNLRTLHDSDIGDSVAERN